MLSDDLRARVNAHADREWPHVPDGDPDVNTARAARRLTFRQGVEWAMSHTTDEDLPRRPYSEAVDTEHGAWDTDDIEEHAHDLLAVVRHRRAPGSEGRES